MLKRLFALAALLPALALGQTPKYILDSNDVVQPSFLTASNISVLASGVTNIPATNVAFSQYMQGFVSQTNAEGARGSLGLSWGALTNTNASESLVGVDGSGTLVLTGATYFDPELLQAQLGSYQGKILSVDSQGTAHAGTNQGTVYFPGGVGAGGNGIVGIWMEFGRISYGGAPWIAANTNYGPNFEIAPTFTNTAAATRTNLGLVGTWLTNSDSPVFPSNGIVRASSFIATQNMGSYSPMDYGMGGSSVTGLGSVNGLNIITKVADREVMALYTNSADFFVPITFGTQAAITRTNLGMPWSGLTNTNSTNFLTDLGLYTTNSQALPSSIIWAGRINSMGYQAMVTTNPLAYTANAAIALDGYQGLSFPALATRASLSGMTRTNLGIPWSGLTNTNAAGFLSALGIPHATNSPAWTNAPAATNSVGIPGQIAYASNYFYICVGTNVWRRAQLGTW